MAAALSIAIVGAGPAGLAAAERLARKSPARIDVLEKLPVPGGLSRTGFAPDRIKDRAEGVKLAKALNLKRVSFWGNVALGRDFDLADLRGLYDAVLVACGAGSDRRISVPGDGLPGVWGAASFLRWLNGDPALLVEPPRLAEIRSVIVVGQGSVALEVARLLARQPKELAKSVLDPAIAAQLAAMPLQAIHVVGRNGLAASRFGAIDLAALKKLSAAQVAVDADSLASAEANADDPAKEARALLRVFNAYAGEKPVEGKRAIRFHFGLRPLRLDGTLGVERALFTRPDRLGQNLALRGELVIAATGQEKTSAYDRLADARGLIAPGLYAAGWAKSGPKGNLAAAVKDARAVADRLLKDVTPQGKPGRDGLARLLDSRGAQYVDRAGWQRLDKAERAAADKPRPRRNFRDLAAMLAAAEMGPVEKKQGELF